MPVCVCVCVCACVAINIYIHTYIHTYTPDRVLSLLHTYTHAHTHTHTDPEARSVQKYIHSYIHTHTHTQIPKRGPSHSVRLQHSKRSNPAPSRRKQCAQMRCLRPWMRLWEDATRMTLALHLLWITLRTCVRFSPRTGILSPILGRRLWLVLWACLFRRRRLRISVCSWGSTASRRLGPDSHRCV